MVRKDRTFIDAIKNYYASDIKDEEKHDTEVESMFYIDKLKHLLVMERDSKRFKVYDTKTGKFK
jgi:WD40 repeat protein